jgi:hypothetical protein
MGLAFGPMPTLVLGPKMNFLFLGWLRPVRISRASRRRMICRWRCSQQQERSLRKANGCWVPNWQLNAPGRRADVLARKERGSGGIASMILAVHEREADQVRCRPPKRELGHGCECNFSRGSVGDGQTPAALAGD